MLLHDVNVAYQYKYVQAFGDVPGQRVVDADRMRFNTAFDGMKPRASQGPGRQH